MNELSAKGIYLLATKACGITTFTVLQTLWRNRQLLAGSALVFIFIVAAVLAPLIAPYDYQEQSLKDARQGPSFTHLFGTDDVGRDILSRIIYGARISLVIAGTTVMLSVTGGVLLGLMAGYFGRLWETGITALMDVLLTIPPIILAIAIVSVLSSGVTSVIVAVIITLIPRFARLVRGVVLVLREQEYVTAARLVGARNIRIIFHHILPNVLGVITVQASLGAGQAILIAAALSFLGLGVQPPAPEWGAMLSRGRTYLTTTPHMVVFPGLAIFTLVLGFNLLGDGLRDALDPRLRHLP